jgi:nitrite reductase/ring-hydroxylating ferredoxin subunit
MTKLLLKVPLKSLRPGINWVDSARILIHRNKKGQYRACRNVCRHMYGLFVEQGDDELICMRHGWILDPASMTYTSPSSGIQQAELELKRTQTHLLIFDTPET